MSERDLVLDIEAGEELARGERPRVEQLQVELLRRQLARTGRDNAFYRALWAAAGVDPERIRSLSDSARLPLVHKEEFEHDVAEHPPLGRYQGPYPLARVQASSGTTGDPKPFGLTRGDWFNIGRLWSRRLHAEGLRAGDLVQIAFTFALFIPGFSAAEGVMQLGATVLPTGSGAVTRSARQLSIARQFRSTALGSTGSYALHLAEVAEAEGYDPRRDFAFRRMFHTGEPLPDVTRAAIAQRWGCPAFDNYGSVETGAPTFQCEEHAGFHIMEDAYLFEIVDPVSRQPLPPGADGAVVVTSLFKEAAPVIRYWTGDGGRLETEPCRCGRRSARIVGLHRLDDMVKIRGVAVYPQALERILQRQFPQVVDYRVILTTRAGLDVLQLEVETAGETAGVGETLRAAVRAHLGVDPAVEIYAAGRSPWGATREVATKIRRVEDRRA